MQMFKMFPPIRWPGNLHHIAEAAYITDKLAQKLNPQQRSRQLKVQLIRKECSL